MKKEFIEPNEYRNNVIKLLGKIYYEDHFVPDVIYASLRGGAYMANIFSEFYKVAEKDKSHPVFYAAVVARSYSDMKRTEGHVVVDGWTYLPEYLRSGDKILLVDDIFDTGKTVNALTNVIMDKGIPREDIKVAVYDYKVPLYKHKEPLPIQPDYYCRKHVLNSPEDEVWIHYLYHEIECLSKDEVDMIFKNDKDAKKIIYKVLGYWWI